LMLRWCILFLLIWVSFTTEGQTFSAYMLRIVSPGCGAETNTNFRPELISGLPPCVSYSGISRVNVICSSAAGSGDHYSAQGFPSSDLKQDALDASTYLSWSFSTQANARLTLTETALRIERTNSPAGPRKAELYYTLDGGGTLVQISSEITVLSSNQQLFFTLPSVSVEPSSEIEFRLYAWDEPDSGPLERDIRVKGASAGQTYNQSTGILGTFELLGQPDFDNFNLSYCSNQTTDVFLPSTSQNGFSGTWSPESAFTPIQLAPGQYTFTFTPSSGQCAPTSQITVTITEPFPLNWTDPPPTQFCASETQTITLPTSIEGASGTWTIPFFTPSSLGPGIYSSTFTADEGFCFSPLVYNFEITPTTTPQFSLETVYCALNSNEITLPTSDGSTAGNWSPAGFTPSALGSGAHTFIFTPLPEGCASPVELIIEVTEAIEPIFNILTEYCQTSDEQITLPILSNNSIAGVWTPTSFVPSDLPSGINTFTFSPQADLCATPTSIQVDIIEPEMPEWNLIQTYCASDPTVITLPSTSVNNISGTWTPASFVPANQPNGLTISFVPNPGSCATPLDLSISIEEEIIPIFDLPGTLCGADITPFTLPTISSNAISGTWSPASFTPNQLPAGIATFQFTPNPGSQCVVGITSEIEMLPPTTPSFDVFGNLCGADMTPFVLPIISNNMISGTWEPSTIIPSANPPGSINAIFVPNPEFCALEIQTPITIIESTTPVFELPNSFCGLDNDPFVFPPSTNGVLGSWIPTSIIPADFQNSVSAAFTPAVNVCASSFEVSILVQEALSPIFNFDLQYCTSLDQIITLPVISNNQPIAIQGIWSIPSFNPSLQSLPFLSTTFTPSPGFCASPTTIDIQFESLTISLPSSMDICSGNNWSITAVVSGNPLQSGWTLPNGQTVSQNPLTINQVNTANSGIYYFEASGIVCFAQSCTELNVLPEPSITILSTNCDEDTYDVEFSASSEGQIDFTAGSLFQIDPLNFILQEIPVGVSVQITLTSITNTTSCANSVSVNPPDCDCPDPAFINNMTLSNNTVCEGQTTNASVILGGSAINGFWSADPENLVVINNPFDLNTTITSLSPGTVFITFTSNDPDGDDPACDPASFTLQLTITEIPSPPSGSGFVEVCQGSGPYTIQLSGQNLRWFDSNFQFIGNQPPVIDTDIPGEYNFAATQTIGLCESIFRQVTVTVIERPEIPSGDTVVEYCLGAIATPLIANGSVLIWRNSDLVILPGAPTPSTSAIGTQTFFVSNLANGCESLPLTITVEVTSCDCEDPVIIQLFDLQPTTGCVSDSVICQVALSGIVTSGTWTCNPINAGTFENERALSTIFRPSIDGIIRITFTSDDPPEDLPECNRAVQTGLISRSIRPNAPIAQSFLFYCFGAIVDSIQVQGEDLKWYDGEGLPIGSPPTILSNIPGSTLYNVTQTIGNCESLPTTIEIVIGDEVSVPIGVFTYEICQGDTFSGFEIEGDSLIWFTFSGVSLDEAPQINSANIGLQRFFVSNNVNSCTSNRQLITVEVDDCDCADPIVNLGITAPKDSFCFGESIQLFISLQGPVQAGTWIATPTSSGMFSENGALSTIFTPSASGWFTFTFISDDPPGDDCEAITDSIRLWVNPPIPTPVLSSATEYCLDSIILPLVVTGANVVWLNAVGEELSSAPIPDNGIIGEQFYQAYSQIGDCRSDTLAVSVRIIDCSVDCEEDIELIVWSISQDTICLGSQVRLSAQLNQPAVGGTWRSIPANSGTFTTISPMVSQFRPSVAGTIVLIFDSGLPLLPSCEPISDTFMLIVRPTPSPPGLVPDSVAFCLGEPFPSLSVSGQQIRWFNDQFMPLGNDNYRPNPDRPGNFSFYINQTVAQCSSAYSVLQVTVYDLPSIQVQQDTNIDCTTGLVDLGGLNPESPSLIYTWQTSSGQVIQTGTSDRVVIDEAGEYVLLVRNQITGCTAMDSVRISTFEDPDVFLMTDTLLMIQGESIQHDVLHSITLSDGFITDFKINGLSEGIFDGVQFNILQGSSGIVNLTLGSHQGVDIILTISIFIQIGDCTYIRGGFLIIRPLAATAMEGLPNVIFPEAGGFNSTLRFSMADIEEDSSLEIFNRWGQRVFQTSPYRNDWSAQGLPAGVYFYVWRQSGLIFKQHVTVMK
jgi:hypothetical protein